MGTTRRRVMVGAAAAAAVPRLGWAQSGGTALTAATGWRVEYDSYPGAGPLAIVFLHGKNGSHRAPNMRAFGERMAAAGITALLPSMPWSRAWNGTVDDARAAVDALAAASAQAGKRVVVGGLSVGATFSMVYRPADPPAGVVAKAFINPGGLLDLIPPNSPFWRSVGGEVERAKQLEAQGQGKVAAPFAGANAVGENLVGENYTMTPEVYLSFHDPARFPSVRAALGATRLPVFWTSGSRDPTQNAKRRTFEMLPRNPVSVYAEPDGDHNSAFLPAVDPLLAWLAANFSRT